MKEKECIKCGLVKALQDYNNDKFRKDGKSIYCRECAAINRQKYNGIPKKQLKKVVPVKVVKEHREGKKICTKCGQEKKYSEYARNGASKDKYTARCKSCCLVDVTSKKTKEINYAKFYYPIELD